MRYFIRVMTGHYMTKKGSDKNNDKDNDKDKDNDNDKYILRTPSESDPRDL